MQQHKNGPAHILGYPPPTLNVISSANLLIVEGKTMTLTEGEECDRIKVYGQSIVDRASFTTELDPDGSQHHAHT